MNPLQPPIQWPPPAEPPPSRGEQNWSRWPIVGIIPRWILGSRRRSNHIWNVLEPIQNQIVTQLVDRDGQIDWPTELHARVAALVARAIADEKSIKPPPLHPDDRFDLLFWGAYDDMTPLVFCVAFQNEFRIDVSWAEMQQFYDRHQTLNEFVNYCIAKIHRQPEVAA
jgi:hypothetical protein